MLYLINPQTKLAKELNIPVFHEPHRFCHQRKVVFTWSSLVEGLGVATIEASAIGLLPI